MEVPVRIVDKQGIDVIVYRTMIPVYHPEYAPLHPAGAEPEELATLLASGWFTSPEAMAAGVPQSFGGTTDDAAVDAMVSSEREQERRDKKKK